MGPGGTGQQPCLPPPDRQAETTPQPAPTEQQSDDPLGSLAGQIGDGLSSLVHGLVTPPAPEAAKEPEPGPPATVAAQGPPPVVTRSTPASPAPANPRRAPPAASGGSCTRPARDYIDVRSATEKNGLGDNGYIIENRCAATAIAVNYVRHDKDCDEASASDMPIPPNRWIAEYSYCDTRPEIVSARFIQ